MENLTPFEKICLMNINSICKIHALDKNDSIDFIIKKLSIKNRSQKSRLKTKLKELILKND